MNTDNYTVTLLIREGWVTYNKQGEMVASDWGISAEDMDSLGIVGIYDFHTQETNLWENIWDSLIEGKYNLTNDQFLHNGQVIDEGRVVGIHVDNDKQETIHEIML